MQNLPSCDSCDPIPEGVKNRPERQPNEDVLYVDNRQESISVAEQEALDNERAFCWIARNCHCGFYCCCCIC